ncbi:MAG TPA: ribonuclease D [Verrucomicrobiae bacterium]|jgi:ribonuclease D|nr:ribonuclease D [Verrucomicrobiae bacterium]
MNAITIDTDAGLATLCERVRNAPRVGLDTEFHAERTYAARLMVVQLAFEDGAAIVDPLAIADLAPLARALEETTVVGHALSSDLKIFADKFGRVPSKVFDCQVGASFLGYGMQISLADLVRDLTGVRLTKSQTVSDWSSRPLSARQIEYLVNDVAYLLPLQDKLLERLRENGRESWALDECAMLGTVDRYLFDERRTLLRVPGSNRMNRRELGVLDELVRLRDKVARDRDLPAKYVIPEDVLASLATLRPKSIDDLSQLRRLDGGMKRALGERILTAVARGEAIPDADLPEKPAKPLGNARETLVAMLNVAAGEIARENDLPPSLLLPRHALDRVAREVPQDREGYERALGVTGWRLNLVGEPLWRLLCGETVVRIEGYTQGDPKIRFSP